jgi:hypothetical protein
MLYEVRCGCSHQTLFATPSNPWLLSHWVLPACSVLRTLTVASSFYFAVQLIQHSPCHKQSHGAACALGGCALAVFTLPTAASAAAPPPVAAAGSPPAAADGGCGSVWNRINLRTMRVWCTPAIQVLLSNDRYSSQYPSMLDAEQTCCCCRGLQAARRCHCWCCWPLPSKPTA